MAASTCYRYEPDPLHPSAGSPLRGVGLTVGVIGMAILIYLSGVWVFTDEAIGDRPFLLMGVLFVLLAMQLISLGLVAEMIINREVTREDPLRHVTDWTLRPGPADPSGRTAIPRMWSPWEGS